MKQMGKLPPPIWMLERFMLTVVTGILRFYRFALSPLKPPCCRFSPTCSAYALEALHRFGFLAGGWLAVRRLFKCHPFYRGEWWDPVPPAPPPPRKSSHG